MPIPPAKSNYTTRRGKVKGVFRIKNNFGIISEIRISPEKAGKFTWFNLGIAGSPAILYFSCKFSGAVN